MRSARPKPLHMICGRAMVLHVIHALELVRPTRTALVVGHGAEQVTKKVQERAPAWANVVFVEQATQRGTGDAAAHGMTAFPGDDLDDDSTIVVLPGDTPLLLPETLDELVAAHVANGSAATLLTSVRRRPDRLRPRDHGARTGGCCASSSSATPRPTSGRSRGRHEHLRLPARPARPGAAPPVAGQRPGRVLPHRRHRRARRHGPPRRPGPGAGRGDPGRQRPLAAGPRRAGAAVAHEPPVAAQRRHDARPAPDVHRRHRALGRDVTLYPGTILEGNTVVGDGCEIGPDTRLDDCVDRARAATSSTPSASRPRSATGARVGPYAHLPPGSHVAEGAHDRGVLHCCDGLGTETGERQMEKVTDQEAGAVLGAHAPRAGHRGGRPPRHRARAPEHRRVRQRRGAAALRRERARQRRLHPADATTASTGTRSTTRSWSS